MWLLRRIWFVSLLFIMVVCFNSCKLMQLVNMEQTINPLQYGLNDAKTGEERYYVLKKTHEEAQKLGVGVSYYGINEIKLEIPKGAKPIPITHFTDFAGVKLQVENTHKSLWLFSLSSELIPVEVTGIEIDSRDFSNNDVLRTGLKLLIVNDSTPWVENRTGHNYGATRKEIMLISQGYSGNGPVQSYCTSSSKPVGYYCDVSKSKKTIFKNVTLNRTNTSTAKTNLIIIENRYDVELSNITINTPEGSGLYGDRAISVLNCIKVAMSNISINGTYSQTSEAEYATKYGYGISLNNTYDFYANNVYARANWGVFGNNNVNKAVLEQCDINRFDIHCYGKDISFIDCNFVDLYTSFASVYGLISYKNCTFTNCRPLLTGSSYNAYVGYDVYFENCTFNLGKKNNSIIDFSGFCVTENSRPELKEKCLPNVTMVNCTINLPKGLKKWYIYNTAKTKDYEGYFGYVSNVVINGLKTNDEAAKMEVFSKEIKTANKIKINQK